MSVEHHDPLLQNDIKWLSKDKALKCFCDLREVNHIQEFYGRFLLSETIFKQLNMGLQTRDKTVIKLIDAYILGQPELFHGCLEHRPNATFFDAH